MRQTRERRPTGRPPVSSTTARRDLLTVEAKLITPVLTVERPHLVLLVDVNLEAPGLLQFGLLLLMSIS